MMIAKDLIDNQLKVIREYITYRDYRIEKISTVDVAWHLDHSLKVINSIADTLINSDPKNYRKDFNVSRKVVFAIGRFPRGKGHAPRIVQPPDIIKTEDILQQIDQANIKINALESLHKNANFRHKIFGMLDLKKSIKFMEIHTNHHLSIIKDIINSKV